jgi:signal transduction histidine kinase/pSer/pThr/pTyr-binding forkhead associated (FHA) protein
MASLYVIRGRDNGQHFLLRGSSITIGRDNGNQIQIHDTEVSRYHARIDVTPAKALRLTDLGSSNGTFVNSRKVESQILRSGDRVQVGRTLMIFTGGPEPLTPPANDVVNIVGKNESMDLAHIRSSIQTPYESSVSSSSGKVSGVAETLGSVIDEPVAPPLSDTDEPRTHWEIVYLVGQAISRTVDLDDLLRQVLDLIFQWISCDHGCILMIDDVSGHLTPSHSRNRKQNIANTQLEISRTILDYVIANREGVLTSNAQDDSRWENVQSIVNLGIQEAICVPMLGRYGLVGAIYIDTSMSPGKYTERGQVSSFNEDHLKLLFAIASQAALAVEDTQFYRAMLQSERLAAMGQTIANLSHHVKNILQGVRGGSYLIEDGLRKEDFDVVRKGWRMVERNQDRISNLVMDMLSFSKERQPELLESDLGQTITDVVELMQARANELNVQLRWQDPLDLQSVSFDPEAMHRAILNVVTNAIDAAGTRELGIVEITAVVDSAKQQIAVCVTDNGEGITPEDRDRIFSPFESKKGARGTGLGLPVSRKILREHGGDVDVDSTPGHGTTFILRWPMQEVAGDSPTLMD